MDPDPILVRAFLVVARHASDECERAGALYDDLPELVFAAAARWCEGDASALEDVKTVRHELEGSRVELAQSVGPARSRADKGAMRCLRGVARSLALYLLGRSQDSDAIRGLLERASKCLCYVGEAQDAAAERVHQIFASAGGVIPEERRA